jgi:hypothetical protein
MRHNIYATAFIASLSLAFALAPSESFGRSGAVLGGKSASTHSVFRPSAVRSSVREKFPSLRVHGRRNAGWARWATAWAYYGTNESLQPSDVAPNVDVAQSRSEHVAYTYDVHWDAVHRYPPVVRYASGCRSETVTVPRGGGKKQSVKIVRCY